jgi:hypothetical protein
MNNRGRGLGVVVTRGPRGRGRDVVVGQEEEVAAGVQRSTGHVGVGDRAQYCVDASTQTDDGDTDFGELCRHLLALIVGSSSQVTANLYSAAPDVVNFVLRNRDWISARPAGSDINISVPPAPPGSAAGQ